MTRKFTFLLSAIFMAVLLVVTGAPVNAQEDSGFTLVDRAVQVHTRSFPNIGEPEGFTYTFSAPTTDSSLLCPFIEGYGLDYAVVPYQIALFYGDTTYVYHAAGDGSQVAPVMLGSEE